MCLHPKRWRANNQATMSKKNIKLREAKASGLKFYESDVICGAGHVPHIRRVCTNVCVACERARNRNPRVIAYKKAHYQANKERNLARAKEWYVANRESAINRACKYQKANLPKLIKQREAKKREKAKTDPRITLRARIKAQLQKSLRNIGAEKRGRSSLTIIGCTLEQLKSHLERQFVRGMTWDNRSLWHIDHIIPLASAETEKDVLRLSHFTNLRPMWAMDNIKKSDNRELLL